MKKIISILLSLLALLGLPQMVYAQEEESCIVIADTVQTVPRAAFTVPVRILNNPGFTNLAVSLEYDPELLELVEISTMDEDGPYLCGAFASTNSQWKLEDGQYRGYLTAASGEEVKGDGILFTATFQPSTGFTDITVITPKVHYIRNNSEVFAVFEEIPASVTEGTVTVVVPGDVNGDGLLEYDDVMLVYMASIGETELSDGQIPLADINGDSKIDNKDVEAIYRIYTGG